jgi:hypothetical protein
MKFRQSKLISGTVKELEEQGRMYFGQLREGKPRIIILVAVDPSGVIVDARLINLIRVVKPATAYDLPEIIGKRLDKIIPSQITNDIETREVMHILINSYMNATGKNRAEVGVYRVKSKRTVKRPNLKK